MTRQDVRVAVRRAKETITALDSEEGRGVGFDPELSREVRELLEVMKRAYMMGPSGQACPTCGGTGRI